MAVRTKLTLGILLFWLFAMPVASHAADTLLHINPNLPGSAEGANPGAIVANLYQAALLVAAFLAFGSIVYAGLQYALSSVPGIKSDAKERIIDALLGLLLLVGAYLLLYIINPAIVLLQNPTLDKIQEVKEGAAPPAGGGNLPPECRGVKNGGCVYKVKEGVAGCENEKTVSNDDAQQCKDDLVHAPPLRPISQEQYNKCYTKILCQRGSPSGCSGTASCSNSYQAKQGGTSACQESAGIKAVRNCIANLPADKRSKLGQITTTGGTHDVCSCHFGGSSSQCREGAEAGGHAIDFGFASGVGGNDLALANDILKNCPGVNTFRCGCENGFGKEDNCDNGDHIHCNVNSSQCACDTNFKE